MWCAMYCMLLVAHITCELRGGVYSCGRCVCSWSCVRLVTSRGGGTGGKDSSNKKKHSHTSQSSPSDETSVTSTRDLIYRRRERGATPLRRWAAATPLPCRPPPFLSDHRSQLASSVTSSAACHVSRSALLERDHHDCTARQPTRQRGRAPPEGWRRTHGRWHAGSAPPTRPNDPAERASRGQGRVGCRCTARGTRR